jgi:hypothetical protein
MKKKIERKLFLKKEGISQLQPDELSKLKGGDELLSLISCVSNHRTCGNGCCPPLTTQLAGDCGSLSRGCGSCVDCLITA